MFLEVWNNSAICACVSHTVSSSRRTSSRTSLSGWYKMISLLESIDVIEIKNYGSANIVQMGTINIGFAPMYIVKCKLSYIKKKKQKIKPP